MKRNLLFVAALALVLSSCQHRHKFNINDYVDPELSELEYKESDNNVRVPFKQSGGVKTVQCLINGTILTDMILDSGCSGALISISEAQYLWSRGELTENDYMGKTKSMIADGSIVEDMVFNIKSIVIADKIECRNVEVTVSANPGAPLLLGNEVLDRMPSYSVDNARDEIVFTLK